MAATPVVDIDGTFFVQAGLFITLMLVLNPLLFKPWLATQARRKQAIEGSFEHATALHTEAASLTSKYDARLAEARERAQDVRGEARRAEELMQAKALAEARASANETLAVARSELADEAHRARQALSGRVDDLAEEMAAKILGGTN